MSAITGNITKKRKKSDAKPQSQMWVYIYIINLYRSTWNCWFFFLTSGNFFDAFRLAHFVYIPSSMCDTWTKEFSRLKLLRVAFLRSFNVFTSATAAIASFITRCLFYFFSLFFWTATNLIGNAIIRLFFTRVTGQIKAAPKITLCIVLVYFSDYSLVL